MCPKVDGQKWGGSLLMFGEKREVLLNHRSCLTTSPSLKTPRLPRGGGSLTFANTWGVAFPLGRRDYKFKKI